jgi:hypothetical protein
MEGYNKIGFSIKINDCLVFLTIDCQKNKKIFPQEYIRSPREISNEALFRQNPMPYLMVSRNRTFIILCLIRPGMLNRL